MAEDEFLIKNSNSFLNVVKNISLFNSFHLLFEDIGLFNSFHLLFEDKIKILINFINFFTIKDILIIVNKLFE